MDRTRLSGMAAGPSVLSACAMASALAGIVDRAEAHEPPFGTGVYASGTQLVLRMSRGLVLRSAAQSDYRFVCNEALGVVEHDAASVVVRPDRSLLVGTSAGLKRLSADGCTIDALPAFAGARVSALVRDPRDDTRVYAATDAGLYQSEDDGDSFVQLDGHAFDSLDAPAGLPNSLYVSGKLPSAPGHVRAYVARWHSGDALELHELALEANEYGLTLLGSDAGQIVAVARAYLGTPYLDRLLVSSDGARSWQSPLSASRIAAFAVAPRTGTWLVGDATGLWRTSAEGEPPEQLTTAAFSCLSQLPSGLYGCDGAGAQGGVSVSADGGEHWRSVLRWSQLAGLTTCSPDAPSVQLCQAAWADWAREVPPDLELAAEDRQAANVLDGGGSDAHNARSATSCAAFSGKTLATNTPRWWWLVLLSIFMRTVQRLRAKRLSMITTARSVITGASLALCLVSACTDASDSALAARTSNDAGPSAARDSGTPLQPNRLADASQDGERTDAAQSGSSGERSGRGAAGSEANGGAEAAASGGRNAGHPQSGSADAEPNVAGSSASGPDADAGPNEPGVLCASCGGCEEIIKVVSTMHTDNPVTYRDPPPTSGPHNPCWGRWGIHDEPLAAERWVHNLEHGGVVFLYNCPEGCETEVATLKNIATGRSRTIVTPYANLPTRFGVVSWGHRLISNCLDEPTYVEFYKNNFDHGPESNSNHPNTGCPP